MNGPMAAADAIKAEVRRRPFADRSRANATSAGISARPLIRVSPASAASSEATGQSARCAAYQAPRAKARKSDSL